MAVSLDGLIAPRTEHFRALPDEAPLTMAAQSLGKAPPRASRPASAPRWAFLRRLLVIGGAVALTIVGAQQMNLVLNGNGTTVLGLIVLALFVVLFAWIALAFTSALAGFFAMLTGGGLRLMGQDGDTLPVLSTRTVLLLPTYNETPARIMAGLQAIHESLEATGRLPMFDLFVLSDTTDPDIWIAEEAAFLALRARIGDARVFYRRRPKNTERKAGNVCEWVRRFGAAYPQMMTLDADSVMDGQTIVRLAAAMERHPDVALIQTLPVIVNGGTLFARMQQFAGRLYGPVIAQGIAWWHGAEGNYWGHNAIIRTEAFAAQAGLPLLKGRKPFGGHILSHDFVEAALMRRAGWAIHMVPGLSGSYEEGPPSLTDVAIRDRRWCQGNLQHAKVLPARGLHWVSRLHLLMGIGSYLTSPLWLLFLLAGVLISLQARFVPPEYFGAGKSLFPNWPQVDPVRAEQVFIATMAVLLIPKLLGYLSAMFNQSRRRGAGGAVRAAISVLIETLLGGLIAPIAMLIQSGAVVGILFGRDSGWNAQRRDDEAVPWRAVWASYWRYTAFGLVLAAAAWSVSPALFLWMTPVLLGLALAVPLVSLTSSRRVGVALRRLGLLQTAEEARPPTVLLRAGAIYADLKDVPIGEALASLTEDSDLRAAHLSMLPPGPRDRKAPLEVALVLAAAKLAQADSAAELANSLSSTEKAALLGDRALVERVTSLQTCS